MTLEIATNDSVDSLPPKLSLSNYSKASCLARLPFRIAEFPDLTASEAMLAITSGRASNMMRSTPIGQVTLVKSRPSSNLVRSVTFPTVKMCAHLSASY